MSAKGSKNCCCNGCFEKPTDRALGSNELQPQQQYCCACIPTQICVTVESYSSGESVTVLFSRDCTAVENDPILYSGFVTINETSIDLQFLFRVVSGVCYICIRSTDLGVSGTVPTDCIVINDTQRASPNYFCWKLLVDGDPAAWVVGDLTISIAAAQNTAIEGRHDCVDGSGTIVSDTHPIKNLCGGCGCICECACVMTYGDNRLAIIEEACLSGTTSWITYSGVEIALVANYDTGCCELELVETPMEIESVFPANRRRSIGGVGNRCPTPTAWWSAFTLDGDAIFFSFLCSQCGCPPVEVTGCCDGYFPRILTATITTDCPDCGSITMSLIYDDTLGYWVGTQPTGMCDHSIELQLSCNGYTWTLAFLGNPCVPATANGTGSCNPISLSFAISTSGIGCCGLGSLVNPTLNVTITE